MYSITTDVVAGDKRDIRQLVDQIVVQIEALKPRMNDQGRLDNIRINKLRLHNLTPIMAGAVYLAYRGICTQKVAAEIVGKSISRISQCIHRTARIERYDAYIDYKENISYVACDASHEIAHTLRVGLGPRKELMQAALCPSEWKVVIAYHPSRGAVAVGVQHIELFTHAPIHITHDVPEGSEETVGEQIIAMLKDGFTVHEERHKMLAFLAPLRHQVKTNPLH